MDFYTIGERKKNGSTELYPNFLVGRSTDLMIRGRSFYAIWDETTQMWSTDEYDVQRIVDDALNKEKERRQKEYPDVKFKVNHLSSFENNVWTQYRRFLANVSDNSHPLDNNLTFSNTKTKKTDYVSKRLPYALVEGDHTAWDELIDTLYDPDERAKIEWGIGAVISGDSKTIQKFIVLYGRGGTGKGTVLNIIFKLFEGYTTTFEAKALVGNNNSFATEVFKDSPLVAIQHDGDLSRIDDNSKLNAVVSHEEMTMNEKYRPSYTEKVRAFLFMGTNKPVKISDAKSGLIRRLIDVRPTGRTLPSDHYNTLMARVEFELGAIAWHCHDVYKRMGRNYYSAYRPTEMMLQTDVFLNFVEANYDIFKEQEGVTLKQAYVLYKQFCIDTGLEFVLPQYKFRDELRNYFKEFADRVTVDGVTLRSYYSGFELQKFKPPVALETPELSFCETKSLLDTELAAYPAQYAKDDGTPSARWASVTTTLSDIDTTQLHYVKVPENHIVIDFDLKDDNGTKSLERNIRAASLWPPTYAELSKSGEGIHLHYIYAGADAAKLNQNYADGIEVKLFRGGASLRRMLRGCSNTPIASINSGLPLKETKVLSTGTIQSERGLRELIARNLRKEIHPGTKPSVDFIKHILDEAYASGMTYDLTDLRSRVVVFANNSSNQALQALRVVQQIKFKSAEDVPFQPPFVAEPGKDNRIVFFDIEVYPNLFVVCWKYQGSKTVVRMINPTAQEVEALFPMKLVGFNNRRYDNHILWARYMGYNNQQLYALSQKIIDNDRNAMFGEAYNLSYADIYDFSSVKQGLKKFEIQLGILHMELEFPWDQPVAEENWARVVEYCANDVNATEAVFEARKADFVARQILADLSGLTINDTTQKHTAKIVFGDERRPQKEFIYTDLSEMFPGYKYDRGKSTYRGEDVGEGGYVYAEPGMYSNVALLDVASMHPTSIMQLNAFGPYTRAFGDLKSARMAIKHKDYATARTLLGGKLAKHLGSDEDSAALAHALKIVINIVYGLTSAKFDNPFRDPRNKDNIVAKRGALFMIDLKHAVQERGFTVAHIKTDSIKIPDATPEIIDFVFAFGKKYGYDFEHEATYDAFCLVNDAVYIARKDDCITPIWTAVGAQFQHPYVFKKLFSKEEITFKDLCEPKSVTQGSMYLSFGNDQPMALATTDMHFVGRTGLFVPVKEGVGGGILYRVKDDKQYAVAGTKGYFWLEAENAKNIPMDVIDMSYFERLADAAFETIDYYGPFSTFVGK